MEQLTSRIGGIESRFKERFSRMEASNVCDRANVCGRTKGAMRASGGGENDPRDDDLSYQGSNGDDTEDYADRDI